jgi:hypothetical protein
VEGPGCRLAITRRKYGHAPKGGKAQSHCPYGVGKRYSIILAIDYGGVVTYLITDLPGTTTVVYYQVRAVFFIRVRHVFHSLLLFRCRGAGSTRATIV